MTKTLEGTTVILGASGFLGTALKKSLAEIPGVQCVSTTHQREIAESHGHLWLDIRNQASVVAALDRIGEYNAQNILNLISLGVSPSERSSQGDEVNYAKQYAQLLRSKVEEYEKSLRTLVNVSTENIYEFDDSYSRTSRAIQEELSQCPSSVNFVNVSLPRVFGPGEPRGRFVSDLVSSIRRSTSFEIEEPDRIRRLVHIDDVVSALSCLLTRGESSLIDVVEVSNQNLASLLSSENHFGCESVHYPIIKVGASGPVSVGVAPYTRTYEQTERQFLTRLKCLLDD